LAVFVSDPDDAATTIVVVVGGGGAALDGDPQPVNKLRPTTLAVSNSTIFKRRFLKPKKQNAVASAAP
jgi:hypothetical protein